MYVLKAVVKVLVAQLCPILCNPMDYSQQAPLSMGFPRQEYWSRLPLPSPGDLPAGIKPSSPALAGGLFITEPIGKPLLHHKYLINNFSVSE